MSATTKQSEGFKMETKLVSKYKTRTGDQLHAAIERQERQYKLLLCTCNMLNAN